METKYIIETNKNSFIKLPPNYTTDDSLLKKTVDLFNSEYNGWSKMESEKGIDVYKNDDPEVKILMLKTYTTVNYPRDILMEAFLNQELKKNWNSEAPVFEIIQTIPEKNQEILYGITKTKIPFVSDRDMVNLRTVLKNFPNDKSALIYTGDTEHVNYPVTKQYVRAKTMISAFYFEEIEPNKCKVGMLNQLDPVVPNMILNAMAAKIVLKSIENLKTGGKYIQEHSK